jgi:hypothetical protein
MDISGFSAANQAILNAMKKFGLIKADNGSAMYVTGTPDSRWNIAICIRFRALPLRP